MTLRANHIALLQTAQQSLALLEAQATAVAERRATFAAEPDAHVRGSDYMLANGLYGRLVDAINYNQIVLARLLGVLDPFDDGYSVQPPIPLTLTPYGLVERVTGFSSYQDPTPQQFLANVAATVANGAIVRDETQKPADVATFYDGRLRGNLGDALLFRVTCTVRPSDFGNIASQVRIWLDYGAGTRLFEQTKLLTGYNVVEPITYQVPVYIGPTFAANGAAVRIEADGAVEIAAASFFVTRLHKGIGA